MTPRHPFFRIGYPLFLIICFVLTGTALQAQPAVDNPDFQNDNGFFRVASGWASFGGNKWEAVWDAQRSFTQGVTDVPPGQMAGVYQQIAVSPGQHYRVGVYARSNRPGMSVSLGIDPAGGRHPAGAQFADFYSATDWKLIEVEFTAAGPTATLFLAGFNPSGRYLWGVWAQFDGVAIESTGIANIPPTAVAAAAPTTGSAPLPVQFAGDDSFDPDGDALSFSWNFGDGSPLSAEANPAHLYTADGIYAAVLTVDDGRGGVHSAGVEIAVSSETASERLVNGDFSQGLYGWTVWRERGAPVADVGSDGELQLAGTGFNGGLYQQILTGGPGTTLTVDGEWASNPTVAGAQWAEVLIINGARLPADGQDLNSAQPEVSLIYKSDSWAYPGGWDGAMAETASVKNSATFTAESEVATIVLKSGNLPGVYSGTRFDGISVSAAADSGEPVNHPPLAAAAADPASGPIPLEVQFTADGSSDPDGDTLTFSWDFGDGHSASGNQVAHTFETAGSFTVTLTANDGRSGTAEDQVTVVTSTPDTPEPEIEWDGRLTQLGIFMVEASVPAGTGYWKLIRAEFLSDGDILPPPGGGSESYGKHAIFYRALDISGNPIDGQKVIAAWPTGSPGTFVEHRTKGPGYDDYWGNFALYGGWCPFYPEGGHGSYGAYVADAPSDQVWGMGLPCSRHVSYRLTWQYSIAGQGPSVDQPDVNQPPTAVVMADAASGLAPLTINFYAGDSDDPDGEDLSFDWDFGDGGQGAGAIIDHTYGLPGTYTATVRVEDSRGAADNAELVIEVLTASDPVGINRVVNPGFEEGFQDGLANGWQPWSVAGDGYWKQSSRLGRIGSGSYGSNGEALHAVKRLNPKVILLEGNALGMAAELRRTFPDALMIGRLYIDHLVSQYLTDPAHYGRVLAENCFNTARPEIDVWQGINEPFINSVADARRVALFEKAFSDRIQELGKKSVVLNLAVGNPGDMDIMLLPEIVDLLSSADYAGYHTYGGIDDQLLIGPQSPWYALRWRFYARMYQEHGLRMPPVLYTEVNTFYQWKEGHTRSGYEPFEAWQIRDDLIAFEVESAKDPWSVGMAIYCLGASSAEFEGRETANEPVIYEAAGDHNWDHPADARAGVWSQQFGTGGGSYRGGVVQRVAVEPGHQYALAASMKLETRRPRSRISFQIGYDPTGQTSDGNADTIVWSDDLIAAGKLETDMWYDQIQWLAATGDRVSVWFAGSQPTGDDPFRISLDEIAVTKVES